MMLPALYSGAVACKKELFAVMGIVSGMHGVTHGRSQQRKGAWNNVSAGTWGIVSDLHGFSKE
jgi:hypothetical protein